MAAAEPTIVSPNASNVHQPPSGLSLPTGWRRTSDTLVDKKAYKRRAVFRGVSTSSDSAYTDIKTAYGDYILELSVSAGGGGAVAEISVLYSVSLGTAGGGTSYDDEPVSEDTYQLTPVTIPTAIAGHPAFAAISGMVFAIEDAILHGDMAAVESAVGNNAAARHYAALRMAGVTTWDATGLSWRVVRHYSTLADCDNIITNDIQKVGEVFAWSSVEGSSAIPEPKYLTVAADGSASAATSYQWRLSGVGVSRGDTSIEVSYEYTGAWKWAKYLYKGGSWEPQLPTSV